MPSHSLQRPRRASSRSRLRWWWVVASAVTASALIVVIVINTAESPTPLSGPTPTPTRALPSASPTPTLLPTPTPTPTPLSPAERFDIASADSYTVVVNKLRPLNPPDFQPADLRVVNVPHTWEPSLRAEAASAAEAMFAAAASEAGLSLASNSAYRSYSTQASIYDGNDTLTARPGHSEHQTGLAIDIGPESGRCSLSTCFADTPEGQWLAANAWRWGFVLRYPNGKTDVTGYQFEPWHYRYVGNAAAAELRDSGVSTLEEFFELPAAPNY